jgi:hypothetical protein
MDMRTYTADFDDFGDTFLRVWLENEHCIPSAETYFCLF